MITALVGLALYGVAVGSFQGGAQLARGALKTPLVVFGSLLLCAPSLYVFTGLSGGRPSLRRLLETLSAYAALLALILLALAPISWLFSAASSHAASVTLIHTLAWLAALVLAWQVLRSIAHARARHPVLVLWTFLLLLVSFQLATNLRPVLWHEEGRAALRERAPLLPRALR